MRGIQLVVLALFISCIAIQGQIKYGFKAGANIGALIGPIVEGGSGTPVFGPNIGVFAQYKLSERWSFQPELSYCHTGLHFTSRLEREDELVEQDLGGGIIAEVEINYIADANGHIKLHYVDLPLLIVYKMGEKFDFTFGPRVAYLLKGELSGKADATVGTNNIPVPEEEFDESDQLKVWDFGFSGGGQYHFTRKLSATFDLSAGLTSVNYAGEVLEENYYNIFLNTSLSYSLF